MALLREELGRRIRTARKEKDLSQQELAELVGLKHAQDISRYERGKTEIPDFRIDRIAEATERPRSYFMRDPAEPEPVKNLDDRLDRLETDVAELRADMREVLRRLDDILPRENAA